MDVSCKPPAQGAQRAAALHPIYWQLCVQLNSDSPAAIKPCLTCWGTKPNTLEHMLQNKQNLTKSSQRLQTVQHKHRCRWQGAGQSRSEAEQKTLQCSQMKFMYMLISKDPRWILLAEMEEWPTMVMHLLSIKEIRLRKDSGSRSWWMVRRPFHIHFVTWVKGATLEIFTYLLFWKQFIGALFQN